MRRSVSFYLVIGLLFSTLNSFGTTVYWTSGAFGTTDWNTATNWFPAQVPIPGDDVVIGITYTYSKSPVLAASKTIKSLTFGVNSSGSLTINSGVTLTVTGDVTMKYDNASATIGLAQTVAGTTGGTLTCNGSFYIGDTTPPAAPTYLGSINVTTTLTVNISLQTINVAQNLVLNTTSASADVMGHPSSDVNNPLVNFNNGTINVTGAFKMTNSLYVNTPGFTILAPHATAVNSSKFILNPVTNTTTGTSSVLSVGGIIDINSDGNGAAFLDLYGQGTGGKSTFIYSGATAQTVYTSLTGIDATPYLYQNIGFSGAGVKTIQSGTLNIPGNWTSAGGRVDASTYSPNLYFLASGAQTLTDAGSNGTIGMVFKNVFFQGSGTKTLSGSFNVSSTGVLTMAGTATLAAGGNLTLLSRAASSASVAPIPTGTAITGNVKVQRFIKGSSADLSKRGYRFISSAVYTGIVGTTRCFDLKYLLDSTYVSGAAGGGFNAPSTNPSLYIYREDWPTLSNGFTSGNYKGIAKINNANTFDIGTQQRKTTANIADTTTNLPIGNGVLYFFRGNKTDNSTQTGSKVVPPYDFPEDVELMQTGILNTGTVNVKPWYTTGALSYTNSSSLNNAVSRGFALVGNPYAATINWEKFNRNGVNSSIYGNGFPAASVTQGKIWIFNPTTKQYDTYLQAPTISSALDTTTAVNPTGSIHTGDASNMIASGQGFMIRATTTGQTLSFRETAKTVTQPVQANFNNLMSIPAANLIAFSSAATETEPVSPASLLSFRMIKDSINTDDVVLALNDHTANTFSATEDVEDLNGNGALVSLSLISSDSISTAIKQIKLPETAKQVISLLADATTSGRYTLNLKNIENLPDSYQVWLKDGFTNDSLDIRNNNTYEFNIDKTNAVTYGGHRFTIVIQQSPSARMHALSFTAFKTPFGAQVNWKTENEDDKHLFTVRRSNDNGKTFQELGTVKSNGLGNYDYTDPTPAKGKNYYQVKIQNTLYKTFSYSSVAAVMYADTATNATKSVSVYPNPATSQVSIKMASATPENGSYHIKISNSTGHLIKQITSNQPVWQENITELLPGTYVVQVINLTENKVQGETKFVKL